MAAGHTPAPDRLVVRTDRRLVGRLVWRGNIPLVVGMAACIALGAGFGAVVGSLQPDGTSVGLGALAGGLAAVIAYTAGFTLYLFVSVMHMVHREVDVMAVVEPEGMYVAVPGTNAGSAYLPWDAIGSVTPRGAATGARVVVRPVPALRRDHPGARGLDDDVLWRALRARGLTIRTGTALVPHEQVVAAVHHYGARRAAQHRPVA